MKILYQLLKKNAIKIINNIINIIKDKSILTIINDLVIRTNKIIICTYHFIKFYFIFDKNIYVIQYKVLTKHKYDSGGYKEDNIPEQLKILNTVL